MICICCGQPIDEDELDTGCPAFRLPADFIHHTGCCDDCRECLEEEGRERRLSR